MIIYSYKSFNSFVDFEKVINNYEILSTPFGTIDIADSTIRDPSFLPRYLIKFRFDCHVYDAAFCEICLQKYLSSLLGEFY